MDSIELLQLQEQQPSILNPSDVEPKYLLQDEMSFNDSFFDLNRSFEMKQSFSFLIPDQKSFDYLEDPKPDHLLFQFNNEIENHSTHIIQLSLNENDNENEINQIESIPQSKIVKKRKKKHLNSCQKDQEDIMDSNEIKVNLKQSSRHNFPKFVCSQFKMIQRSFKNSLKKKKGKNRVELGYLYSQFFWQGMKESSSLQKMKKYLISPSSELEKQALQKEFTDFLASCNQQHLSFDIFSLQAQAKTLILTMKESLLKEASLRSMEKVEEYVDYLRMILDNLEKGIMKLNHKNQK